MIHHVKSTLVLLPKSNSHQEISKYSGIAVNLQSLTTINMILNRRKN